MKNKKGFTLIELLAVIVILAIIALIAVPIVLNMITQARRSAARSAALGYIDAIEYNNGFANAEMDGYTLITGTKNVSEINVKMKGKKPDSGSVTITNDGKVESATDLCFNGYAVQYKNGDAKVEGKCNDSNTPSVPTIATCPGCNKYIFTFTELTVGSNEVPSTVTDDYTTLLDRPIFIGLKVNEDTGIIERIFACGVENEKPFCLEGNDTTKYTNPNITTLNTIYPTCDIDPSDTFNSCEGSLSTSVNSDGYVSVSNDVDTCYASNNGSAGCY